MIIEYIIYSSETLRNFKTAFVRAPLQHVDVQCYIVYVRCSRTRNAQSLCTLHTSISARSKYLFLKIYDHGARVCRYIIMTFRTFWRKTWESSVSSELILTVPRPLPPPNTTPPKPRVDSNTKLSTNTLQLQLLSQSVRLTILRICILIHAWCTPNIMWCIVVGESLLFSQSRSKGLTKIIRLEANRYRHELIIYNALYSVLLS